MADKDSRSGKRYDSPEIIDWIARTHGKHDTALAQAFAVPDGIPAIQVGPMEGRLLYVLMKLVRAKKIVEVGTLVGYSAIHMARALPPDGHLWSIEFEPRHAEVARRNLATAGLADRASVHVGAALEVLPTLEPQGPFDAVFIDADKANYDNYGQWAITNLRPGGLVIGDNSYLFGELLADTDGATSMRAFHELVAAACDTTNIPTPDGMVVGIKR